MPIVIASGPSVNDYPREQVISLCRHAFTFAVNNAALHFPCDIVVAMDMSWLRDNAEALQKLDKPIITRNIPGIEQLDLKLFLVPSDAVRKYPLSGMLACRLADRLANEAGRLNYALGIDGTAGHFYDTGGRADTVGNDAYESLGLTKTINLSVHSKISAWPKASKLPALRKVFVTPPYRAVATAWVCGNPGKHI